MSGHPQPLRVETPPPPPATAGKRTSKRPPAIAAARSLVDIRSRILLQERHTVSISAVGHLIAELNTAWDEDGKNGMEGRIEAFRMSWILGEHTKVRPLELLDDETISSGEGSSFPSSPSHTATTTLSFVTASDGDPSTPTTRRRRQLPPDASSRGILAEQTIKASLLRSRVLLEHEDYTNLASIARQAVKKVLRTGQPVYVSPGLIDSVDFSKEFEERGWAKPGIRFGPYKPDLIRFEEVRVKHGEERKVSWEVVEVKYSGNTKDWLYTNWKVQALFYYLNLLRLLSSVPHLQPSVRISFWLSSDPFSPKYEERSSAIRTEQAFVEQHLYKLLPEWLQAIKKEEGGRLKEGLERTMPSTPVAGAPASFLEKLQASARTAPPSPSGRQRHQSPYAHHTSPTKASRVPSSLAVSSSPPASPTPAVAPTPSSPSASPSLRRSQRHSSPVLSRSTVDASSTFPFSAADALPPLPPVDDEEEEELRELFGQIGFD